MLNTISGRKGHDPLLPWWVPWEVQIHAVSVETRVPRCICDCPRAQRRSDTNADMGKCAKERRGANTCEEGRGKGGGGGGGAAGRDHPRKWTCAKASESPFRLFSIYTIAASYHSPASSEDSEHRKELSQERHVDAVFDSSMG